MADLEATLRWVLQRRHGSTEIENIVLPTEVTALALADSVTWSHVALVVDEIRIHSMEALITMLMKTLATIWRRKRLPPPLPTVVDCVVVWRTRCTLKKGERYVVVQPSTHPNVAVRCQLFDINSILSHPLRFNIVPQDYRRAAPEELKGIKDMSRLPIMLETDPIACLLGYKCGDIVTFMRCLGSLPPERCFRQVQKPGSTT